MAALGVGLNKKKHRQKVTDKMFNLERTLGKTKNPCSVKRFLLLRNF